MFVGFAYGAGMVASAFAALRSDTDQERYMFGGIAAFMLAAGLGWWAGGLA